MKYARPRIFVSRCINFDAVRYNGQMIYSELVEKLKKYCDIVYHCPEFEIGLGVPRKPVRIIASDPKMKDLRLIQQDTNLDITDKINQYSIETLKSIGEVDGFILKAKSPSSAFRDAKIYPSNNPKAAPIAKGPGFFGRMILKMFPFTPVEDELRLNNLRIRDHFLKSIFTFAAFRKIAVKPSMNNLINFHSNNKLLFMSYNQRIMKELGLITANHEKKEVKEIFKNYEIKLKELFKKIYTEKNFVNVFQHAFGYFSKDISVPERKFILQSFEKYRKGECPLIVPLMLLKNNIIRFNIRYLENQTFFEPYPEFLG